MNMLEIARRAGVSSATVSRVINGSPMVRPATAARIQKIMDEVNFIPNPSALTLKYGRSKTVGLIVPDICNPFYGEFVGAFEDLMIEIDHEVLLTSVQTPEKLVKSMRRMLMRQVDGAILMGSEFETHAVEPLLLQRIPLVTIDRRSCAEGLSDVAIKFETGTLSAIRLLKSLGHSRIGYIGGTEGLQTTHIREKAFSDALKTEELEFDATLVRYGDYRTTSGEQAAMSLMKMKAPPTALLTSNDLTALGAILGLHRCGMQVPSDVSVIGVDDLLISKVTQPPLTTIRIPVKRLARVCIEALHHTKQNVEAMGKQFEVDTELVVRESTAPPPTAKKIRNNSKSPKL